jgi:hypothetical protein
MGEEVLNTKYPSSYPRVVAVRLMGRFKRADRIYPRPKGLELLGQSENIVLSVRKLYILSIKPVARWAQR